MAALCISNATSPHGFLIPPHRYLRDRQSEEQRAGECLLPHGNACPREQGDGALANGTAAPKGGRRSRDSSESGTLLGVGPGLCRTSENSVLAKFGTAQVQTPKSVSEGVSPSRVLCAHCRKRGGLRESEWSKARRADASHPSFSRSVQMLCNRRARCGRLDQNLPGAEYSTDLLAHHGFCGPTQSYQPRTDLRRVLAPAALPETHAPADFASRTSLSP